MTVVVGSEIPQYVSTIEDIPKDFEDADKQDPMGVLHKELEYSADQILRHAEVAK